MDKLQTEKDPAMIAYLKSLGIDPDYVAPKDDSRRVVISEFHFIFKDHQPVVMKFATDEDIKNAKKQVIILKEGCEYKLHIKFRVQHNVVPGFKIENTISKLGKTLDKDVEMLGSYPPSNEFKGLDIPSKGDWHEAPSGIMSRGEYKSRMRFLDDDAVCHLDFEYTVKIAKDWKDE
eukprot:TRINITY_DN11692_c0_g1::TRINITY_DN11692_c0_g1_i1::g.17510::m.17510 TRINITY_DN11692_c0_g1::TRINITY_DN11692_c0_g1_i1::g.17510  ORF type:complete len:199 (+),score=53.46,sp/Q95UQ1/GDIR1_DICDI/36.99/1e-30,Rho_GDI/PF02115.12/3.9e-36 TRINITY_DN11692_c0_g1_i1:72-599(+)